MSDVVKTIPMWIFLGFCLADQDVYDYIVVGCGSAGAVVASRLSEDPNQKVLLLEAGSEPSRVSYIPLLPFLQNADLINPPNWGYAIHPQKHNFFGFYNRSPPWLAGKVLGGTSNLNFNLYVRGRQEDFDNWVKLGATGWNWKKVLNYYMKSENNTDEELANNGFHGVGGPMTVSHSPYYTPLLKNFVAAVKEMGLSIADFNADHQESFYVSQGTSKDGRRRNSYSAFIKPYLNRTNLILVSSAVVTKILIDNSKHARGVLYQHFLINKAAYASKEVILSAGVINSAKLLMLSGIGPSQHLKDLEISVIADLPVGENFHDHVGRPVMFTIDKPYSLHQLYLTPEDYHQYEFSGKGPLTSLAGVEILGFINSSFQTNDWPDTVIFISANSLLSDTGFSLTLPGVNLRHDVYLNAFSRYKFSHTIMCGPIILHPKSRGFVKLKSANSFDKPIINPNYFSELEDLRSVIEGIKFCKKFGKTLAMKEVGAKELNSVFPMCDHYPHHSDEYLGCITRVFSIPMFHGAGTCRMGDPSDPRTVVDAQLRVKGIQNLRVADCSVMPFQISGLPHATAVMIGERAADLIRFDKS